MPTAKFIEIIIFAIAGILILYKMIQGIIKLWENAKVEEVPEPKYTISVASFDDQFEADSFVINPDSTLTFVDKSNGKQIWIHDSYIIEEN